MNQAVHVALHKPYICSGCNERCNGHVVDFGIGPYEFWGQLSVDTNRQWVSDCCDETVLDDYGHEVEPPSPPERDEPEYD